MPEVKTPEELEDAETVIKNCLAKGQLSAEIKKALQHRLANLPTTFEVKPANPEFYVWRKPSAHKLLLWVKARGDIGGFFSLYSRKSIILVSICILA